MGKPFRAIDRELAATHRSILALTVPASLMISTGNHTPPLIRILATVTFAVTTGTERNQILRYVSAQLASALDVVNL